MVYEKATTKARHFDVIVLAGTFELVHGQPVLPVAEQLPLNIADRYVGDPESSAFIEETHLIVAKKNTDIHLIGHAKSPRNEPSKGWPVGVGVGPVRKLAQVSCPRWWDWWPLRGWHLGQHQPTTQVELHSSMAYGGAVRRAKYKGPPTDKLTDDAAFDAFALNPVGLGYVGEASLDRAQFYRAAQIESVTHPIGGLAGGGGIHQQHTPVCFGPVPRWNPQRVKYAGKYDDVWKATRFPYLPDDFDFAFYQSAQPDLIAPGFLKGDEPIRLIGCYAQGNLDTYLPGIHILALLTDSKGLIQKVNLNLDTVTINVDTHTVQLVWRKSVPKEWDLAEVLLSAIPAGPGQTDIKPVHIHRPAASLGRYRG